MTRPHAIVLRAPGTNCDEEAAYALDRAGALAQTWHINQIIESPAALDQFQILVIPGGFSYGDDLGAGRIFATRIATTLGEALRRFHDRGGLVLGICNGFQVLVRSGLLTVG
jgi:phosphoribosylformylglycinamidine (FGAM) synthase-like amidotransferase family enzyme